MPKPYGKLLELYGIAKRRTNGHVTYHKCRAHRDKVTKHMTFAYDETDLAANGITTLTHADPSRLMTFETADDRDKALAQLELQTSVPDRIICVQNSLNMVSNEVEKRSKDIEDIKDKVGDLQGLVEDLAATNEISKAAVVSHHQKLATLETMITELTQAQQAHHDVLVGSSSLLHEIFRATTQMDTDDAEAFLKGLRNTSQTVPLFAVPASPALSDAALGAAALARSASGGSTTTTVSRTSQGSGEGSGVDIAPSSGSSRAGATGKGNRMQAAMSGARFVRTAAFEGMGGELGRRLGRASMVYVRVQVEMHSYAAFDEEDSLGWFKMYQGCELEFDDVVKVLREWDDLPNQAELVVDPKEIADFHEYMGIADKQNQNSIGPFFEVPLSAIDFRKIDLSTIMNASPNILVDQEEDGDEMYTYRMHLICAENVKYCPLLRNGERASGDLTRVLDPSLGPTVTAAAALDAMRRQAQLNAWHRSTRILPRGTYSELSETESAISNDDEVDALPRKERKERNSYLPSARPGDDTDPQWLNFQERAPVLGPLKSFLPLIDLAYYTSPDHELTNSGLVLGLKRDGTPASFAGHAGYRAVYLTRQGCHALMRQAHHFDKVLAEGNHPTVSRLRYATDANNKAMPSAKPVKHSVGKQLLSDLVVFGGTWTPKFKHRSTFPMGRFVVHLDEEGKTFFRKGLDASVPSKDCNKRTLTLSISDGTAGVKVGNGERPLYKPLFRCSPIYVRSDDLIADMAEERRDYMGYNLALGNGVAYPGGDCPYSMDEVTTVYTLWIRYKPHGKARSQDESPQAAKKRRSASN